MPLNAATPSLLLYERAEKIRLPHGHSRDVLDRHELHWRLYDAAWEAPAPEQGVYLRTAVGHPSNAGLLCFYPEPLAAKIRAALGEQVKARPPAAE